MAYSKWGIDAGSFLAEDWRKGLKAQCGENLRMDLLFGTPDYVSWEAIENPFSKAERLWLSLKAIVDSERLYCGTWIHNISGDGGIS